MIDYAKARFTDSVKVTFNEDEHIYKVGRKKYRGTTTYIKQFTPVFDSQEKARTTAIKNGWLDYNGEPDIEYVLDKWKMKSDEALKRGNKIHKYFEDYFKNNEFNDQSLKYINKLEQIPKLGQAIQSDKFIILSEVVIYNRIMDLCGMIDLLMINKETDTISILDFKTNEKMRKVAYNDERLLSPFQFVPNADYQKYKLQLSLYARILELNCNHVSGMALIHINHDDEFELMKLDHDYLEFLRKKFNNPNSIEQQLIK